MTDGVQVRLPGIEDGNNGVAEAEATRPLELGMPEDPSFYERLVEIQTAFHLAHGAQSFEAPLPIDFPLGGPRKRESVRENALRHVADLRSLLPARFVRRESRNRSRVGQIAEASAQTLEITMPSEQVVRAAFAELAEQTDQIVKARPQKKADKAASKALSRMPGGERLVAAFFKEPVDLDKTSRPFTVWRIHIVHEVLAKIDEIFGMPGAGIEWLEVTRDRDGIGESGYRTEPRLLIETVPRITNAQRLRNRLLEGYKRSVWRGEFSAGQDSEYTTAS